MRPIVPGLGVVLISLVFTPAAESAEIRPGGALNISISGFARFLAAYGDLDKKPNIIARTDFRTRPLSTWDFRNDTELHIILSGRHDATGIEYGGQIELEADTSVEAREGVVTNANSDETWIYTRGGFGELRFGDTDSAANALKVGAYTVAVGTGGIDGTIVDIAQPVVVDFNRNDEDRTKVVYFTPGFAGLIGGLSYTPDLNAQGDSLALQDQPRRDNVLSAGVSYSGLVGDFGVRASVVSLLDPADPGKSWGVYGGVAVDVGGFSLAGGIGTRHADDPNSGGNRRNGRTTDADNDNFQRNFFNLGLQYRFDPFAFSITYGWASDDEGETHVRKGRFSDLVFGIEAGLLPGLTLSTEAAYFSFKRQNEDGMVEPGDTFILADDTRKDNDGWVGVTRLALAF